MILTKKIKSTRAIYALSNKEYKYYMGDKNNEPQFEELNEAMKFTYDEAHEKASFLRKQGCDDLTITCW